MRLEYRIHVGEDKRNSLRKDLYVWLLFGLYLEGNRELSEDFKMGCHNIRFRTRISNDYFIGNVEIILERVIL